MNYLFEFLLAALSAIVLQNAVFTRGLGSSKDTLMLPSPRKILYFGGTLTLIAVASALIAWPLNLLLHKYQTNPQLSIRYPVSMITLCCICLVFLLLYLGSRTWRPKLHYLLRAAFVPAAFNCAVLGSLMIALTSGYGFFKTLGFALGSGVGYTLTLLLVYEGRRRIALSDLPRSFRGLPVMLLYIGILSLAIYGLIGHQLPT